MVRHVGCAQAPDEIEALRIQAKQILWRLKFQHQLLLFPKESSVKAKLVDWKITGFHQVFGSVYDRIGLPQNLLRDLVVARIVYPKSKLATIRYLNQTLGIPATRGTVYRFLDTLDKGQLTQIAFELVSQRNQLNLVFYDVTTLYFESSIEDDFRQKGYSKDHRHDMPQILIGLFVDKGGYPVDFDFFEGKTFEGHTLRKMITRLQEKYTFEQLTMVADAGMLSQDNLAFLEGQGIGYIVGAKLKNLPQKIKSKIVSHDHTQTPTWETKYQSRKLLVNYSAKRAKKDQSNRDRQVRKLKQRLSKQQSVVRKSKYLKTGPNKVYGIDEDKILADAQYDGLKGYFTNTQLSNNVVIEQYHCLWQVEKAFRMSKHDLRERPVYHSKTQRIKSHLLLCFVSLLVMKETERVLREGGYSLARTIELLGRLGEGKIQFGKAEVELEAELDDETRSILKLFAGY